MRMYPLPHPAGDNENVEYDKCPEASDEKAAAASFEYRIHRNFFGRQSEILEDENGFIEPHDDDPGSEEHHQDAESCHIRMAEFGRRCTTTLFEPSHPAVPFHRIDVDESEQNYEAQSPALQEPPAARA